MNSDNDPTKSEVLKAVIIDLDSMLADTNRDLRQLNEIARCLRRYKQAGTISDLHYTIDRERLLRTISKCKLLMLTLLQQKQRAVDLLKE